MAVDRQAVVHQQRRLQQRAGQARAVTTFETQQCELAPAGHGLETVHLERGEVWAEWLRRGRHGRIRSRGGLRVPLVAARHAGAVSLLNPRALGHDGRPGGRHTLLVGSGAAALNGVWATERGHGR